jgi:hemerythrin
MEVNKLHDESLYNSLRAHKKRHEKLVNAFKRIDLTNLSLSQQATTTILSPNFKPF